MDWLDHELDFSDQALFEEEPTIIRNAELVEGRVISSAERAASKDEESAYAASERNRQRQFNTEFGLTGSNDTGTKFASAIKAGLHHQQHYSPVTCICYDSNGNQKPCKPGCIHGA